MCAGVHDPSFWWINARNGKLVTGAPHSYALYSTSHRFQMRVPLVLYNTGARPIFVDNFQLWALDQKHNYTPVPWSIQRTRIMPKSDEPHALAATFAVPKRDVVQLFVEFGLVMPGFTLSPGEHRVRIEVVTRLRSTLQWLLRRAPGWRTLIDFVIDVPEDASLGRFIAYSNVPAGLRTVKAEPLNDLLSALQQIPTAGSGDAAEPN